ncbi:MAG: F0F1 ATP synthase subunit delta [bacterium]|nr:F0F1 ATP synthase subunit delta [bacterium]
MAKIKARFYARALLDLTEGKTQNRKTAVASILQLLQKNGQLSLWPQVLAAYTDLLANQRGVVLANVKTEKALTPAQRAQISDFLCKHEGAKNVELTEILAPVGPGLILETTQKRWDLSVDHQIKEFKEQLIS